MAKRKSTGLDVEMKDYDSSGVPPPRKRQKKQKNPLPFPEKDLILSQFTLDNLKDYGYTHFVNVPEPDILFKTAPMHPIFKKSNFFIGPGLAIEQKYYNLIRPALRMASCVFYEPSMQPYFAGILAPAYYEEITKFSKSVEAGRASEMVPEKLYRFRPRPVDPNDPTGHIQATWKAMYRMQDCVRFRFDIGGKTSVYGVTGYDFDAAQEGRFGLHYNTTFSSYTDLHPELIIGLDDTDEAKMHKLHGVARLERRALSLRTYFSLANTLVHETMHAMHIACRQTYPNWRHKKWTTEPFYESQRISELGWATESVLWGGVVWSNGASDPIIDTDALIPGPYGLHIDRFPGGHKHEGHPRLGTAAEYGYTRAVSYPVTMKWIYQFFTKSFWDTKVAKHGLLALKPVRWHGVAQVVANELAEDEELVSTPDGDERLPLEARTEMTAPPLDWDGYMAEFERAKAESSAKGVVKKYSLKLLH